jgi:hypothetical protein
MKNVSFFAVITLLLASSFTMDNSATHFARKNLKSPTTEVYKADRTEVEYNVTLFLCNGDEVFFPSITSYHKYHAVRNGTLFMAHSKLTETATGYSLITGEVYTINNEYDIHNKFPETNGAAVFNNKIQGTVIGEAGSKDTYISKYHLTINANGETTSYKSEYTTDCQ